MGKKKLLVALALCVSSLMVSNVCEATSSRSLNVKEGQIIQGKHNTTGNVDGGCANVTGVMSKVTINKNAQLLDNSALGKGGAFRSMVNTTITEAIISGNRAVKGGGAIDFNARDDKRIFTITGSTFSDNATTGDGSLGGAIELERGTLNISGTTFDNNHADNGAGGAIYQYKATPSVLNIDENSTFTNNSAIGGGALALFATSTIKDTAFITNHSTGEGDGGGGLFLGSESKTLLENVTFDGNTAVGTGGAITTRKNGDNSGATLDIINSTFKNNTSEKNGGAIHNTFSNSVNKSGSVSIINTTFDNNHADNGAGGAIYNAAEDDVGNTTHIDITNGTFSNNSADVAGAMFNEGNLVINGDSSFTGNNATNIAGAICNYVDAVLEINGADFSKNTADWEAGAIMNYGDAKISGALFDQNTSGSYGGAIDNESVLTVDNTTFTGNNAESGGAIYNYDTLTLNDNVVFDNNKASLYGGALYVETDSTATIKDNIIFSANHADKQGGGIFNDGSLTIADNAKFISNSAIQGGAIFQNSDTELTLNNAVFSDNKATGSINASAGGAIFIGVYDTSDLKITNSIFDTNKADVSGGAILQSDGSTSAIIIENTQFSNNETFAEGGAIVSDSILNITNSYFFGNKTTSTKIGTDINTNDDGGGAIMLYDQANATIKGSVFENNSSGTYGGAISTRTNASSNNSSLTVESSNFTGNKAGVNGGAIAAQIDTVITDSSFTNNSAREKGGAVWASQNLPVNAVNSDVIMSSNSASKGGDIYMNTANTNLNINAAEGKSITVASGISGENYNMLVNTDNANTGSIIVNSAIQNAKINVANGTFHLSTGSALDNSTLNMANGTTLNTINNQVNSFANNVTLADNINLAVDVNLANGKADNFSNEKTGSVTIVKINPIGAAQTTSNNVNINIAQALGLDPTKVTLSDTCVAEFQKKVC